MPPEKLKLATDFFKTINDGLSKADFNKYLEAVLKLVGNIETKMTAKYDAMFARIDARVASIKDGQDGKDAVVDYPKLAKMAAKLVPVPKDADPVDYQMAARETVKLIPIPKDGQDGVVDMTVIEQLQADLDALKKASAGPRIGWGAHPLNIQQSGTIKAKGARHINFTGATVTQSGDGVTTVAITGGSSGYQIPTSGTVNGSNTVFTWATAPNVIVLDNGNAMNKVSADGSINWSGTTTTTLAQAPNFNIYATA